jgi:hypothetical protein
MDVLFGTLFVLSAPLWAPLVLLSEAADKNCLRRAANLFICTNCGRKLGVAALRAADQAWAAELHEIHAQLAPDDRLRVTRTADAICPGCGARYSFRKGCGTFSPELLWETRT